MDTQHTLPFGTPEQVRDEVRERIDIFAEDGGYVMSGRIVQEGDDWKQMLVPVYYDLGGKDPAVQQVAVGEPDFTFKAKLPAEPKRVWLDDKHDLLIQVVSDGKK